MANRGPGPILGVVVAAIVGIFVLISLVYKGPSTNPPPSAPLPSSIPLRAPTVSSEARPNVDLQCLVERVEKAPAPFHLSYKKSTQVINSDWETDITKNSINGTVVDSTGTQTIHAARANSASWTSAVAQVTAPITGSARTLGLVRNSSAMMPVGAESINGESTTKYMIDSTRDTAADASEIKGLLGPDGFIKGTAWVTKDGCPVKLVLDAEMHMPDGNVEKEHYEEAVTKEQ